MGLILKVAAGVFLGMLLWTQRELLGWVVLLIFVGAIGVFLLFSVWRRVSDYYKDLNYKQKVVELSCDLIECNLVIDFTTETLVEIFGRHDQRWEIDRLVEDVAKYKRRKGNGYKLQDEIDDIRDQVNRIFRDLKKRGWSPPQGAFQVDAQKS